MNTRIWSIALVGLGFLDSSANAAEILTSGQDRSVNNVVTGFMPQTATREYASDFHIKWKATCYGDNNRNVGNPLSPDADIELRIKFQGFPYVYRVVCPASITSPNHDEYSGGAPATATCTVQKGTLGAGNVFVGSGAVENLTAEGHMVHIKIDKPTSIVESVDANGNFDFETKSKGNIEYIQFIQQLSASGAAAASWLAYPPLDNRILSSSTRYTISPGGSYMELHSAFPGQGGSTALYLWREWGLSGLPPGNYCGGYYSPLMLFFDEERPSYRGSSEFPLAPGKRIYWVEKDAPGFFLALVDKKGETRIERADQLFGQGDGFENGFESLKRLDSNHDRVIDSKDKDFERLVLWGDRDGDGKSTPEEVRELEQSGVVSISLKYKDPGMIKYGGRAFLKGMGTFQFKDPKKGKIRKGEVLDVWFNITPESNRKTPYSAN